MNISLSELRSKLASLKRERKISTTLARPVAPFSAIFFAILTVIALVPVMMAVAILLTPEFAAQLLELLTSPFVIFTVFIYVLLLAKIVGKLRTSLRSSATDLLRRDTRPPILLLRSFADDSAKMRPRARWWHLMSLEITGMIYLPRFKMRAERALDEYLSPMGPFVAIGRPGEFAPLSGARRAYFDNSDWQGAATQMMERSRLIILIPGITGGVGWELDQVLQRNLLWKTIVLLPYERANRRTRRIEALRKAFANTDCGAVFANERFDGVQAVLFRGADRVELIASRAESAHFYKLILELCIYLCIGRSNASTV